MLMTPGFGLLPKQESFFISLCEDNAAGLDILENFRRNQLRKYLYVFIGGAAGGLLRVMTTRADNMFTVGGMDLTILLINITGAFLLGLFLSGTARFQSLSPGLHLGIAVGLFGSFTTFSTLSMEAVGLLQTGDMAGLFFYIFISCIVGLAAAELGFRTGDGTGLIRVGGQRQVIFRNGIQSNRIQVVAQEEEDQD
jgi:fluoride exporter